MKARWQLFLLIVVVLLCVSLAQSQQGHMVLGDLGLYKTASYTELAFSDARTLPRALARPNKYLEVSFLIHNVSTEAHSYHWSIVLVHGTDSQVKASGNVLTAAQGGAMVTKSVTASCTGGRLQAVVRLTSPSESISFWMTCPPAAALKKEAQ